MTEVAAPPQELEQQLEQHRRELGVEPLGARGPAQRAERGDRALGRHVAGPRQRRSPAGDGEAVSVVASVMAPR